MAGRILVVDDVSTNRLLMTALLQKAFYDVETAENGREALKKARANPPDIALIDVMMPQMNGFELCRKMKADPRLAEIPVVMITALDAQSDRRAGIQAGADDFLTKPVRAPALYARMRSLQRMKAMRDELKLRDATSRELGVDAPGPLDVEPPSGSLVLGVTSVSEKDGLRKLLEARLDVKVATVSTAQDAFRAIAGAPPQAVLIDSVNFSEYSPEFCAAIRQREGARNSALLTLIGRDDMEAAAECLDAGANDYVMMPIDPTELATRLGNQLRYKAHADYLRDTVRDGLRLAVIDPLTGLHNRRYYEAHFRRMMEQARESGSRLSVLAFDLDKFKQVNDSHGHAAGDAVLVEFAQRLRDNTRSVDLVARIGGEEFVVAMPEAGIDDARIAGERVRVAVEGEGFHIDEALIRVTVSVGVASLRASDSTHAELLSRADQALFIAKSAGRNRVILEAA